MYVKQVSIFLEHVPGTLYDVITGLMEKDIHIRALSVAELGGIIVLRLVVDNVLWTASHLKTLGYPATFTEVIVINVSNIGRGLCRVLEVMKDANVNLEHAYSLAGGNVVGGGGIVLEVNDTERAVDALESAGIHVVTQEELYTL